MKKVLSVILAICVFAGAFTCIGLSTQAANYCGIEKTAGSLVTGDTFYFGMYPQSLVSDGTLISCLNAVECEMKTYGYIQNSNAGTHNREVIDMTYADIAYNGEAYRKVTINQYRPDYTLSSSNKNDSYQDEQGYTVGNTYYFKWEPIVWQVLAKETGGLYAISDIILDSQAYHDYLEDITWSNSSLRQWLNDRFYRTAFSYGEMEKINESSIFNERSPYNSSVIGEGYSTDLVWVISYSESLNSDYGFSNSGDNDPKRMAHGSDYAKCQGLNVSESGSYAGNSYWWLRTLANDYRSSCVVRDSGYSNHYNNNPNACRGVRPALKINAEAVLSVPDSALERIRNGFACKHRMVEMKNAIDATCTEQGYTRYYCYNCSDYYYDDYTDPLGHIGGTATCHSKAICTRCHEEYGEIDPANHDGETEVRDAIAATCTVAGYTGDTYCLGCGTKIATGESIPALGHSFTNYISNKDATCTADGTKTAKCDHCDATDTVTDTDSKLGHNYVGVVTNSTCTEQGYTTHTCSRCKDSYVDTYVDALGHTVTEWEYGDSTHWHICTACGEKLDEAEHTASDWIIDREASMQITGEKHKECTICGKILETEIIPKLYTPGDINGDGSVNNKDLTRLFQYLSDWDVEVNEAALDINGDGKVNNKDLTRLFQYLSDWDVEIF